MIQLRVSGTDVTEVGLPRACHSNVESKPAEWPVLKITPNATPQTARSNHVTKVNDAKTKWLEGHKGFNWDSLFDVLYPYEIPSYESSERGRPVGTTLATSANRKSENCNCAWFCTFSLNYSHDLCWTIVHCKWMHRLWALTILGNYQFLLWRLTS